MRRWRFSIAMFFVLGCGGSVDPSRPGAGTPAPGAGGSSDGAAGSTGELDSGTGGAAPDAQAGTGGESNYVDPGCPDVPPSQGIYECDPLAGTNECGGGMRCAPYVEYADDCGREVYGSRCTTAGTGIQGEDCTDVSQCAARHVCVTTGEGNQCVQLCDPANGSDDCSPGLLCWWLDVPGTNVCF